MRNTPTRSEHVADARPVASRLGPVGANVPDDVLALVRRVPAWSGVELDVAELHGGITNRNYRVDVDGRSYVIRIPGEATELLGIDRGGELAAAARAADLGIGPPVFGELPGLGTVITGFVPGSPVDGESILAGDRVERARRCRRRPAPQQPARARVPDLPDHRAPRGRRRRPRGRAPNRLRGARRGDGPDRAGLRR